MGKRPSGIARESESALAGRHVGQAGSGKTKKNFSHKRDPGTGRKKNEKNKPVATAKTSVRDTEPRTDKRNSTKSSLSSVLETLEGAARKPMPTAIHPMLATSVDKPFDSPEWLFEIKWDGYRAVCFLEKGKSRLVSR